jgi:hypothetical protein
MPAGQAGPLAGGGGGLGPAVPGLGLVVASVIRLAVVEDEKLTRHLVVDRLQARYGAAGRSTALSLSSSWRPRGRISMWWCWTCNCVVARLRTLMR